MKRSYLRSITKDPKKRSLRFVQPSMIKQIKARSGGSCEFIDEHGVRCSLDAERTPHHVVPRSLGGKHTVENLRDSCWFHNQLAKNSPLYCRELGWDKPYDNYKP